MDRRQALLGALAAAGCASTGARTKAVFVLVHGAWHGSWCWRDVRAHLETAGATVIAPTLTGLGERAVERDPAPTLSDHIGDVVRAIEDADLNGVVLVGHSYAGMVVAGAADRVKRRLAHIVFLDAVVPLDGQSFASARPGASAEETRAFQAAIASVAGGDAWAPPPPPAFFGVPQSHPEAAEVAARLTPHPLATLLEPVVYRNGGPAGLPKTYILCTEARAAGAEDFAAYADRVRGDPEWRVRELSAGHDAMITAPRETAALLLDAAGLG